MTVNAMVNETTPEPISIEQAYVAYRDQLLGYLLSLTRDEQKAEDLLHDCFAQLTREVGAGRAPRNTRAWLYQVARNLVISSGRRQKVAERWLNGHSEPGVGASAEEHYLLREASAELRSALLCFKSTDRQALLMAAMGYSGDEIAAAVGQNSGVVRTRLCRARSRLRASMSGPLALHDQAARSTGGERLADEVHLAEALAG